ncbi:MAG: HEPN domain-containing protein [Candidatus Brocadiales bacterium]|nr:HEPN domain-containing protein [Candidatus Brocadiales bacterium]
MKKSFSHLPKHKRDEIKAVVKIINKMIDAEFVILFGSYARGDWVEDVYKGDDGTTYEYKSDYDLLIVVEDLPKYEYKGYRKRIKSKARRSEDCETRLSIIMHSVDEFKEAIKSGNYFFTDIKKEGILLHSSRRFRLPAVKELSAKERKVKAEANFKNWFESAKGFFGQYDFAITKKENNIAAFELHQAAERFYHTILLVFTDYKPKLHDLEELGVLVDRLSSKLKNTFPKETKEEKRLFELLKRAYTEARYNMAYEITKKELKYLAGRVTTLRDLTEKICKLKIKSFTK